MNRNWLNYWRWVVVWCTCCVCTVRIFQLENHCFLNSIHNDFGLEKKSWLLYLSPTHKVMNNEAMKLTRPPSEKKVNMSMLRIQLVKLHNFSMVFFSKAQSTQLFVCVFAWMCAPFQTIAFHPLFSVRFIFIRMNLSFLFACTSTQSIRHIYYSTEN